MSTGPRPPWTLCTLCPHSSEEPCPLHPTCGGKRAGKHNPWDLWLLWAFPEEGGFLTFQMCLLVTWITSQNIFAKLCGAVLFACVMMMITSNEGGWGKSSEVQYYPSSGACFPSFLKVLRNSVVWLSFWESQRARYQGSADVQAKP